MFDDKPGRRHLAGVLQKIPELVDGESRIANNSGHGTG